MLFNSLGYLLFLAIAVVVHWALPRTRWRLLFLGLASVSFYAMWRWEFTALILFSSGVDFVAAGRIAKSDVPSTRKRWLLLSLFLNLGLLVVFKYTYFIHDNVRLLAGVAGGTVPSLDSLGVRIILPLGISFYTFQTISYSIDVYRGVVQPTKSFATFLTYVSFWPQLVAGPVLRAGEVIPELERHRVFSRADGTAGLLLVITGLFKKVVLADSIAPWSDAAFGGATDLNATDVWVAAFVFGFQIYFDFSGYSDIAIGSARLLGIRFPRNFWYPYVARSPKEFWSRWHISLSAWIRDYLYLPLTGQRFRTKSVDGIAVATESTSKRTRALVLTWLIMGLWHGAAWNFALWGLYHAALILAYRRIGVLRALPERRPWVAWGVMLLLSMAGWIAFRATSVEQAVRMFGTLLNPLEYNPVGHTLDIFAYLWVTVLLVAFVVAAWLHERDGSSRLPARVRSAGLCVVVAVMTCSILACMRSVQQFIYFQF